MGREDNYRTDDGVDIGPYQVQAIREFVGLSVTWLRKFMWNKERFEKELAPFFNGNPQDDYHNIALRESGWDPYLVSKRKDIQMAIEKCIEHTAMCILTGRIYYDAKEVFKLKVHRGSVNCKEVLYHYLKKFDSFVEMNKETDGTTFFEADRQKELKEYANEFFLEWKNDLYDVTAMNWKILKTYENDKTILEKIRKLIAPQEPRLLDGKIIPRKDGKFKFKDIEDQRTEYKQSMFSPDLSEIKHMEKTEPKIYSREEKGRKYSLIDEILSSVCAFLNTNNGDVNIGIENDTRYIVGLSDDRNSKDFKKYEKYSVFQEEYKKKIVTLMKNKIKHFDIDYVDGIGYPDNYGEYDNGDEINILRIPCKKIPSSKPPVFLKKSLDKKGNKMEKEILYERVDESDEPVPERDRMKFYHKNFRIWKDREFPDE